MRWLAANDPEQKLRHAYGFHYFTGPPCPNFTGEQLWEDKNRGPVTSALRAVAEQEARCMGHKTPFEDLMDTWSETEDGRRLLEFAHRLIVYAMTVGHRCAFTEGPDRLDRLIALVQPTTIVTLNYDTLTEEALRRLGFRYSYPDLAGPRGSKGEPPLQVSTGNGVVVPMFKLHGSINWVTISGATGSATLEIAEEIARSRPTHIVQSGPFVTAQTWATYAVEGRQNLLYDLEEAPETGEPVIAVYGTGKHVLENPEHVDAHREACFRHLGEADAIDCVIAVGIRAVTADDDPVVCKAIDMLAAGARHKVCADPDPNQCTEFERRGFISVRATLEEFVAK